VWDVFSAHPQVHPQSEWAIPALLILIYRLPEGWKAELAWVAGYVVRQFTSPKAVTHPTTNRAQCRPRATALIETNALPLPLNRHRWNDSVAVVYNNIGIRRIPAALCHGNRAKCCVHHVTSQRRQSASREEPSSGLLQLVATWRRCNHSNATRPCASRCRAVWLADASAAAAPCSAADEESSQSWRPSWTDTQRSEGCRVGRTLWYRSRL